MAALYWLLFLIMCRLNFYAHTFFLWHFSQHQAANFYPMYYDQNNSALMNLLWQLTKKFLQIILDNVWSSCTGSYFLQCVFLIFTHAHFSCGTSSQHQVVDFYPMPYDQNNSALMNLLWLLTKKFLQIILDNVWSSCTGSYFLQCVFLIFTFIHFSRAIFSQH